MGKRHFIIPIFIPHKGCPFDCVFCNQKRITGLQKDVTADEVEEHIIKYMDTIPEHIEKHIEIAFYGGSFTGIELNIQKELLSVAYGWKKCGVVKDIRISTRPDYINSFILQHLKEYGVSIIELGVQSMSDYVLEKSGRGHSAQDVFMASKLIKKWDIKLGLQMMLGLPGDSVDQALKTADDLISLNPDFVRIYPTLVIKDTFLENEYYKGRFKDRKSVV